MSFMSNDDLKLFDPVAIDMETSAFNKKRGINPYLQPLNQSTDQPINDI